jgi:hypothetical protein
VRQPRFNFENGDKRRERGRANAIHLSAPHTSHLGAEGVPVLPRGMKCGTSKPLVGMESYGKSGRGLQQDPGCLVV